MKKKETYEAEMLAAIKKHKIMRFEHAFGGFVGFSKTTAYLKKLNESDAIKEALEANRNKGVVYLVNKWLDSDNATLQIAAMRLICDSEDHRRLNQQYQDHTTQGDKITGITVEVIDKI